MDGWMYMCDMDVWIKVLISRGKRQFPFFKLIVLKLRPYREVRVGTASLATVGGKIVDFERLDYKKFVKRPALATVNRGGNVTRELLGA